MLDILRPRNSFGRSKFGELNFTIPPPRDGEELAEISSSLNLTQLGLSDEGNYSCAGVNSQGNGESDFLLLEVSGSEPFYRLHTDPCSFIFSSSSFPEEFTRDDNTSGRRGHRVPVPGETHLIKT